MDGGGYSGYLSRFRVIQKKARETQKGGFGAL